MIENECVWIRLERSFDMKYFHLSGDSKEFYDVLSRQLLIFNYYAEKKIQSSIIRTHEIYQYNIIKHYLKDFYRNILWSCLKINELTRLSRIGKFFLCEEILSTKKNKEWVIIKFYSYGILLIKL